MAALALWGVARQVLPVYFIGVGEKLEDLQTFDAASSRRRCSAESRGSGAALVRRRGSRRRSGVGPS